MTTTRADLRVGWLLVAIAVAGCSDRTGVLLEVTRDEATVPADIDRLRFFVGVEVEQSFVDDGDPAAEVDIADGRDLLVDPYVFLLSPGDTRDDMDMVAAVVAFQGDTVAGVGAVSGPIQFIDGKVLSYPVLLEGNAGGSVVITETGCLIWNEGGQLVVISTKHDRDCDGDPSETDCDDSNPGVGHGRPEVCSNGTDDDCDGDQDEVEDADIDGVDNCSDCDDTDDQRFPGNREICDGLDNDCNARCDDGELDVDHDDYTVCDRKILEDGTCSDPSEGLNDCDDGNADVHPLAEEVCNGVDNNCDGSCDDEFDGDSDMYTTCGSQTDVCDGASDGNIDCEPELPYANPGILEESCDDADDDCDGVLYPDSVACYVKANTGGEDFCLVGNRACDDGNLGWSDACIADPDNATRVPMALCDAYLLCQDQPDPYACANEMAAPTTHACTVFFASSAPGEVCPSAAAILPHTPIGDPACQWTTTPARNRPTYDVVLDSEPTGVGGTLTTTLCQPMIVVRDTLGVPQAPDSWLLLQQQDGVGTQIFRVNFTPMPVATCPQVGMTCVGLAPPGG